MIIKRLLFALAMLAGALHASADSIAANNEWKYIPTFHGTLRAFYQLSTETGQSRFLLSNARLSAGGFVLPAIDYYLQVDFCDHGKIKLLDAFVRANVAPGLDIYGGQMRVPFSVESSRFPHLYYFTDVGLVALFGNLRSVGVKAGYRVPKTRLYVEGGVFNASDMTDHKVWNSALTYSIKANYNVAGLQPEIAFMSRVPGGAGHGCRINQFDAAVSWTYGNLFVEGEYIWRHYCGPMKNSVAYSVFANYGWPVKWWFANKMSLQARFEGLTGASRGMYVDGSLPVDIKARKRLTFGATTSKSYKKLKFDFKINFEQYFYDKANEDGVAADDNSKLVAGAVLYF